MKARWLVLGVTLAVLTWASAEEPQDGIVLEVRKDAGGAVKLTWSGGTPGFQVFRSTETGGLTRPANQQGETNGQVFADPTPPAAPILFYLVTSSPTGTLTVREASSPEPCTPPAAKSHQIQAEWSSPYRIRSIQILRNDLLVVEQQFDCTATASLTATVDLSPTDQPQTRVTLCYQELEAALTDEIIGCPIAGAGYLAADAAPGTAGETRTLTCAGAPGDSHWVRTQNGAGDVAPTNYFGSSFPLTAAHRSSVIDDLLIARSHTDRDGDRSLSEARLTVVQFQLKQQTFSGAGFHRIRDDFLFTEYAAPHWQDADLNGVPERSFPVSYVRGTPVSLKDLAFGATPAGLPACTVEIEGRGPGDTLFTGSATLAGTDLLVPGPLVASVPLPNAVKYFGAYPIQWSARFAGSAQAAAGSSANRVYVLLDDPLGDRLESYFDIATKAADGESEVQAAFNKLWDEFKDLEVRNVRGERMGYYRGILCASDCTVYEAPGLITQLNGQCGSWADLLMQTARTLGIDGTEFITIEPDPKTLPRDCSGLPSDYGFLVKNYSFTPQPGTSGCANFPLRFNGPCGDPMWPESEVTDVTGLPGQDEANPASDFSRHFIVKFNLEYFDPSYGAGPFTGTKAQANLAWEKNGIAAYTGWATTNPYRQGVRRDRPDVRETFFDQ